MRTAPSSLNSLFANRGVTLVELIVFIVVISIALAVLLNVFAFQVTNSVDPVARVKALERGQAVLDEILSRKFDENTPTGGVPACDSPAGDPCAGITTPDSGLDDVGDYNGTTDNTDPDYPVAIQVTSAGGDLGIAANQARLVTVTVTIPGGETLTLNAYRVNF